MTLSVGLCDALPMRRADRLFRIIQHLRSQRSPTTAQKLSVELEVSPRTVYRDIRDLQTSGVPIRGEAGVGYMLSKSYDLPPVMFDEEELEALVLGARLVRSFADPGLGNGASRALAKIESVLPSRLRERVEDSPLYAVDARSPLADRQALGALRQAIHERKRVAIDYCDAADVTSSRTVLPLALYYWGPTWTLAGWCELRGDFRTFRVDRLRSLRVLDERFELMPGRTLEDLMRLRGYGPDGHERHSLQAEHAV
jgi:predicted DNA-binding transcriptional regulator YafY